MLVKLYKLLIIKQKHYFRKIRTQKYYHTEYILWSPLSIDNNIP